MRTLNLNSKEIGCNVHGFIYSLCVSTVLGFLRPFTRCPTPHLKVRHVLWDRDSDPPRHLHTVSEGSAPDVPMGTASRYGKLDAQDAFVTVFHLKLVVNFSISLACWTCNCDPSHWWTTRGIAECKYYFNYTASDP